MNTTIDSKQPRIFLSHSSSDDRKYGDALRNLICKLGVKDNQLIYTSHMNHRITTNKNICDYLRKRIGKNVFMIYLLSKKYFESPACLNEMGAAWLAKSDYTNIFLPGFNFNSKKFSQCVIDQKRIGIILNGNELCVASIIEFCEQIIKLFNLSVDVKRLKRLSNKFLKEISQSSCKTDLGKKQKQQTNVYDSSAKQPATHKQADIQAEDNALSNYAISRIDGRIVYRTSGVIENRKFVTLYLKDTHRIMRKEITQKELFAELKGRGVL